MKGILVVVTVLSISIMSKASQVLNLTDVCASHQKSALQCPEPGDDAQLSSLKNQYNQIILDDVNNKHMSESDAFNKDSKGLLILSQILQYKKQSHKIAKPQNSAQPRSSASHSGGAQ